MLLMKIINEDSEQDVIDSFADFLQVYFTFDRSNCLQGKIVLGRLCYFVIYYNNYIQCWSCKFSFVLKKIIF